MCLPSEAAELRQVSSPITVSGSFSIYRNRDKVFHKQDSEAHEVAYCVGSGATGRSYFIRRGDELFVSPLSYYAGEKRWDLSPGHDSGLFRGFTRPAGDLCVSCHGELQVIPGTYNRFREPQSGQLSIGCERCHGAGGLHPVGGSIVNPAKLPNSLRDDICNQCHLAGDARVLKPGKSYADFGAGSALDDVVSIFSVPAALKPEGLQALGHVGQLHASRCWTASQGRMGCITCHNPHDEPAQGEAAGFFRSKCLGCHESKSCRASRASREQTQPPDNCIGCHMPKRPLINISHTALTDHRILRDRNAAPGRPAGAIQPVLIRETKPISPRSPDEELRTVALAYAQVAANYREFAVEGFSLLERAAEAFPSDPEVQATYGIVLLLARPRERAVAESTLQRAIDLGSKSLEARLRLAGLKLEDGDAKSAVRLCQDAVRLEPFLPAAYLRLSKAYAAGGDHLKAAATLESLLAFDPGNEAGREALERERSMGRR